MSRRPLELPPLVEGGCDLRITDEQREAIDNDGTCEGFLRYFRSKSCDIGGFVEACLANDLLRMLNNRGIACAGLEAIRHILNDAPIGSFGSYEKVTAWTKGASPPPGREGHRVVVCFMEERRSQSV